MIEIVEVKTRKQQKLFIEFPLKLYKNCEFFVPPLYGDEMKIFGKNFTYSDTCIYKAFLAYKDGILSGRIMGIVQNASNEKRNEKRIRFSRFDSIDDQEVSNALFDAVEKFALSIGLDTVHGPLSFSDLEREGLLIDGFDQLSTFEEQYNYPYYQKLIENYGYVKEVDWFESKVFAPDEYDGSLDKTADFILKRYNLHVVHPKSKKELLTKYLGGFFDIVDKSYENIYGTVPFTENMKKEMCANFNLIIELDNVALIADENEKIVCIGICFASIAKAVQKSGGRLTPGCIVRLLKAIKKPDIIDLGLIGVDPEYANKGVSVVICANLIRMLQAPGVKYAETNLNLEDNAQIRNIWTRHFKSVEHKKRRAFVKKLTQ